MSPDCSVTLLPGPHPDAANMLFHVVNDRHRKKRTMIFTTNKPLTGWGRVLHDEDLAHAIVDRILERGRLLTLDGPSMRTRHLGLDDPTANPASTQSASLSGDGARISGIQRPEFPEPTSAPHDTPTLVETPIATAVPGFSPTQDCVAARARHESLTRWLARDTNP